jgi:type II secretory pathway predicted ATPase ExeA
MIRAHFGLDAQPFSCGGAPLLAHQQEIFDTLRVHCQQGGLCVVVGEPGTGKSVIKNALARHDEKRLMTPVLNRTLHTYHSILHILCEAFQIDADGRDVRCERRLIDEAARLNHSGKMLAPTIDDAHLMDISALRRLRLLFEDFPKNHNLILVAQPALLTRLALTINDDIKSRVTYSVLVKRLAPDDMETFILAELDRVGLGHNTFTPYVSV